ncbi:MAG: class I SAM-dependent methyltransferase [Chitinophagaceae bacterium]|nr:class I SAM-dependent methyltransferase [Chitinophagaceae bacterium]
MNKELITYYRNRAKEYEAIYQKPERQADLESATRILQQTFTDKIIIEISCGTGYWTQNIAKTAASIFATDINETVLEIARNKQYENENVKFGIADFNNWEEANKYCTLFGGFIWSHILLQDIKEFLTIINRFVLPGGTVVFIDNNYVAGSNTLIAQTDENGNTFQERTLQDGSAYMICKNFPTENFVRECLKEFATDIKFIILEYYWLVIYHSR